MTKVMIDTNIIISAVLESSVEDPRIVSVATFLNE